jgi:hypothetical protein
MLPGAWQKMNMTELWFILSEPCTYRKWYSLSQMGWWHHIHDLWRHPGYSNTEQGMCSSFTMAVLNKICATLLTNAILNKVHATLTLRCVITLNTDYIRWNINETPTSNLCFFTSENLGFHNFKTLFLAEENLSFSQWWLLRVQHSQMWPHIVWYVDLNVSWEPFASITLSSWRWWRHQLPPELSFLFTKLQGITSQKCVVSIFTTVWTSDHIILYRHFWFLLLFHYDR